MTLVLENDIFFDPQEIFSWWFWSMWQNVFCHLSPSFCLPGCSSSQLFLTSSSASTCSLLQLLLLTCDQIFWFPCHSPLHCSPLVPPSISVFLYLFLNSALCPMCKFFVYLIFLLLLNVGPTLNQTCQLGKPWLNRNTNFCHSAIGSLIRLCNNNIAGEFNAGFYVINEILFYISFFVASLLFILMCFRTNINIYNRFQWNIFPVRYG